MDRMALLFAFETLANAMEEWKKAYAKFSADFERGLVKCMYAAMMNGMSIEQFADGLGMTPKTVRALMRKHGLDPKKGKRFLSDAAAKALQENAELLGIDPVHMDLTSPLAYLPMGSDLRASLESEAVKGVKDVDR